MNDETNGFDGDGQPIEREDGSDQPARRRRESLGLARHRARTLVLKALYEADTAGHDPAASVDRLIGDDAASDETAAYARSLVSGIKRERARIDDLMRRHPVRSTQLPS